MEQQPNQLEQPNQFETLFDKTSNYLETSLELIRLKSIRKSSDIVSVLVSKLILYFIISIFLFIVNIGVALLLGELLGKSYYGFFVLAGFYVLVGIIFYASRKSLIEKPVSNAVIKNLCD